ncbi:hypothetical protein AMTR_s00105p00027760 [Amborella trichopoda]|uniref:Uncharacterized protein n=1 Tax=Amborella trichopoda TaxID=13333 RepID=W1NSE4_AMBTC|nr:hypothetical protein AMTR_s00105p00027760 [Amborella trichopoda]
MQKGPGTKALEAEPDSKPVIAVGGKPREEGATLPKEEGVASWGRLMWLEELTRSINADGWKMCGEDASTKTALFCLEG